MSRRYELDEEETSIVQCEICDGDIIIDPFIDIGDSVVCEDCGAYYLLRSHSPVRLLLTEGDDADESLADLDFDD